MARDRLAAIRAQQSSGGTYSLPAPPSRPQFDQYGNEAFGNSSEDAAAAAQRRQLSARRPSAYQPGFNRGPSPNQYDLSQGPSPNQYSNSQNTQESRQPPDDPDRYQHRSGHSPTPQDFDPRSSNGRNDRNENRGGRNESSSRRTNEPQSRPNLPPIRQPPPVARYDERDQQNVRQNSYQPPHQSSFQQDSRQNRQQSFQGNQQERPLPPPDSYSQSRNDRQNSEPSRQNSQQSRKGSQIQRQHSYIPAIPQPSRQPSYSQQNSNQFPQSVPSHDSRSPVRQPNDRSVYSADRRSPNYREAELSNPRRPSNYSNHEPDRYKNRLESQETLDEKYSADEKLIEDEKRDGKKKGNKKGKNTIGKGDVPMESMEEYFDEISYLQSSLQKSNATIKQISTLHSRRLALPSSEDPQAKTIGSNLEKESTELRKFLAELKNRIFVLEQGNANLNALIPLGLGSHGLTLQDVDVRSRQLDGVKEKFKSAIQNYADVERESREKSRNRMERSVMVVNPNLSHEEVIDVVRNAEGGGEDMFSSALLAQNQRSGKAKGALKEVQNRAKELAKIEETLIGLGQLFNDMALLVDAQDVQVQAIERNAEATCNDVQVALVETKKAVVHAKSTRKMRKLCFGILLLIIIIVVIVVVVQVIVPAVKKNNSSNASSAPPPPAQNAAEAPLTPPVTVTSIEAATPVTIVSLSDENPKSVQSVMQTVLLTRPSSSTFSATNIIAPTLATVTRKPALPLSSSIINIISISSIVSDTPLTTVSSSSPLPVSSTISSSLVVLPTSATGNDTLAGIQKRRKFKH